LMPPITLLNAGLTSRKVWAPWRRYSNSCRSMCPGLIGKDGTIFSRACTPDISSIDTVRVGALAERVAACCLDRADLGAFGLKLRVGLGREPEPHAMRLQVGLFLACARPSAARSGRPAHA
jgi:hypothetical protein